tara:strand:- start:27832 stop:28965 length:1134 start_codon:yes stop_codon:yes gene_type:complete
MMEVTILSWLVLELTDSPFQVALVGISRMSPMFLLGLVAGSIADKFPKKRTMVQLQIFNIFVTSATFLMITFGDIQPIHVFLSTFCLGSSWSLDFATRRSFFAELFDEDNLSNAVSLDVALLFGSLLLGPMFSGALIRLSGFPLAYGMILIFYLFAFLILVRVPKPKRGKVNEIDIPIKRQLGDAINMILSNRSLWSALTVTVALNFFGFPYLQMVPVIARDVLDANAFWYGVLVSSAGLGSLVASLFIASKSIEKKHVIYSLGATLMLFAVLIFSLSNTYIISLSSLIVAGIGMSGFATMQPTIALQAVDKDMQGRSMGAIALGIGAAPPGMWALGQLSEYVGPQNALTVFAISGIIVITLLRFALPELRDKKFSS